MSLHMMTPGAPNSLPFSPLLATAGYSRFTWPLLPPPATTTSVSDIPCKPPSKELTPDSLFVHGCWITSCCCQQCLVVNDELNLFLLAFALKVMYGQRTHIHEPLLVLVVCVSSHQPILTFTLGTGVDVKTCQYSIKFRQECIEGW